VAGVECDSRGLLRPTPEPPCGPQIEIELSAMELQHVLQDGANALASSNLQSEFSKQGIVQFQRPQKFRGELTKDGATVVVSFQSQNGLEAHYGLAPKGPRNWANRFLTRLSGQKCPAPSGGTSTHDDNATLAAVLFVAGPGCDTGKSSNRLPPASEASTSYRLSAAIAQDNAASVALEMLSRSEIEPSADLSRYIPGHRLSGATSIKALAERPRWRVRFVSLRQISWLLSYINVSGGYWATLRFLN
jgi:hypothetical protein